MDLYLTVLKSTVGKHSIEGNAIENLKEKINENNLEVETTVLTHVCVQAVKERIKVDFTYQTRRTGGSAIFLKYQKLAWGKEGLISKILPHTVIAIGF